MSNHLDRDYPSYEAMRELHHSPPLNKELNRMELEFLTSYMSYVVLIRHGGKYTTTLTLMDVGVSLSDASLTSTVHIQSISQAFA
jgi:hypothetical protein